MLEDITIQTLYLIIAVIISSFICIYGWRNRQARGSRTFIIACLTSIVWMSGDIIGRLNNNYTGQLLGEFIRYLGAANLPVAVFVFANQYCGRIISRENIIKLLIIPALTCLLVLTSPWHEIFFSASEIGYPEPLKVVYGYYFWAVHIPYSYILLLASFAIFLIELVRTSRHYRPPIFLFLVSFCIPFIINILGVFKVFTAVSYTPLSFPLFFIFAAIAIYRFQFLGSNPIAYESVFQTIRDGVILLDRNNRITDINPAAARVLSKTRGDIIGQNIEEAFLPWKDSIEKYRDLLEFEDEIEVEFEGAKRFISITITQLKNTDGSINGRIFMFRDITDRRRHQLSLEMLAFQDPLTGLSNRLKFQQEAEMILEQAMISGEPLAVLYCDLDRFKAVNDTMGHQTGDELLKYVAARLSSVLKKQDLLARLGGDEFAVLLRKTDKVSVHLIVKRIFDSVQKPFQVGEFHLTAKISIGAAFYPDHGENFSDLIRHADKAMYQAKAEGVGLALFTYEKDK